LLFFDCAGIFCVPPLTLPSLICGERVPEKRKAGMVVVGYGDVLITVYCIMMRFVIG